VQAKITKGIILKYEYKPKKRPGHTVESLNLRKARSFLSRNRNIVLAISAILIVSAAAYVNLGFAGDIFGQNGNDLVVIPELFVSGYTKVEVAADVVGDEGMVTLTSGCRQILAYVEPYQAQSIQMGLRGVFNDRPNTHDIATDAFQGFGIQVLMVKIDSVSNGTYFGKLILRMGNTIQSLDARPSDATAIAIRMGAPIYVKNDVMQEFADDICTNQTK
jgi:bifunctional DNase/RNase